MAEPSPRTGPDTGISLQAEVFSKSKIHTNVSQEFIVTTTDKAKLCLITHQRALESKREWLGPTGMLLTVVASLVAADFQPFLGLAKDVWRTLFLLLAFGSAGWLVSTIVRAWRTRGHRSVESVVESLKRSGQ